MNIKINYLGQIRKTTRTNEEYIELNRESTIQDFIKNELCQKHQDLGKLILEEDGTLRSIILIFDDKTKVIEGVPRNLRDGSVITIMTPITGG